YRDDRDNIIADYKPPLALQKATWVDRDGSRQISAGDLVRLEFSKYLQSGQGPLLYTNASPPTAGSDLWFSPDVSVLYFLATSTMASKTEVLIELAANASSTTFFPGSSTVRISPTNTKIKDFAGRNANGSDGEYPCLEVIIKAN
ncbi:MAG: hypothetical protein PHV05_10320, partial [Candidatus Riflebacteria bacterium]|nr:hypothetical protein [Candidatus Riflebacteria bacterium]